MVVKCRNCGHKVIERPIWKGQEAGEPFAWNKINWWNMIIPSWHSIMLFSVFMILTWSYSHDTKECFKILENPCVFVEKNKQPCAEMAMARNVPFVLSESNNQIQYPLNLTLCNIIPPSKDGGFCL